MESYDFKRLAAILIVPILTLQAWAYTVSGRIKAGKEAVSGIEIRIFDKDGNEAGSATTDNKGAFKIDNIDSEGIVVEVSGEGYNPLRLEVVTGNNDTDLGILNLEKTTNLQEVTVTAKSRVMTPDKTIVYVTPTERERAAGPYNMLTLLSYKAPEIQVRESERSLTIDGESPEILVNGIRRTMSYINAINDENIERIEFSPVPDIRYGKRYLNIIVRRPPEGGWLMADLKGAVTTPRNFVSGVAEYSRGRNDFMLYYNGGFRHARRETQDEQEHYIGGGKDITLGMKGLPSSTLDRYHNLSFYFTHVNSEKSTFAATAFLNLHDNHNKLYSHVTEFTRSYERENNRGYNEIRPNLSLYYYLKASNTATIEIEAVGSYGDYDSHRNLTYSTGYESLLSTKSHSWYTATQAAWVQVLPFARLKTGLSFSYNDAFSKYNIDGEISRQPLSSIEGSLFSSLGGNLFTVGYNISLGWDYLKVKQGLGSPNLSLSLQRNLGNDFGVSYSFGYSPGMPPISTYNDVVTPVNELMYHVGDDKLKAQSGTSNRLQFAFNKNNIYISLQGQLSHSANPFVTAYSYQDDPNSPLFGYFLERTGNGISMRNYGINCFIGLSNLFNFLSFRADTGWEQTRLKATETFNVTSWRLNLNMGLYWRGWQLNVSADNLLPAWSMSNGTQKYRYSPFTDIALYKKFGLFNINVTWRYPFQKSGMRFKTESLSSVVTHSSEFRMGDQGNMLEIGIRYQIVTGKLISKQNRTLNHSGGGATGVRWSY